MGVTGNFQTKILTTETTRTYNYANYEKLSRRLFDIFILSPLPNDSLDQSSQLTTMS